MESELRNVILRRFLKYFSDFPMRMFRKEPAWVLRSVRKLWKIMAEQYGWNRRKAKEVPFGLPSGKSNLKYNHLQPPRCHCTLIVKNPSLNCERTFDAQKANF